MVMLGHKIAVYVPSTIDVDKALNAASITSYVHDVVYSMAEMFGGATTLDARGAWIKESDGKLVEEKVTIVYSYCDDTAFDKYREDVKDLCEWIKEEMKQEAVSMELDGSLYLI